MKTSIKLFTLAIVTLVTTSSLAAGFNFDEAYSHTNESDFGWYEISTSSKTTLEANNVTTVFEISYDMLEAPVTVTITNNNKEKYFTVRGTGFEARYTLVNEKFGIDRLVTDISEMSKKERRNIKSNNAYNKQRIITQGKNENDFYIGLIAGFLPEIVRI